MTEHGNDATLRKGVWRRATCDWAYRVEVEGIGSVAGVGFSSRDEAREAMIDARLDLLIRHGMKRAAWKGREQ